MRSNELSALISQSQRTLLGYELGKFGEENHCAVPDAFNVLPHSLTGSVIDKEKS